MDQFNRSRDGSVSSLPDLLNQVPKIEESSTVIAEMVVRLQGKLSEIEEVAMDCRPVGENGP